MKYLKIFDNYNYTGISKVNALKDSRIRREDTWTDVDMNDGIRKKILDLIKDEKFEIVEKENGKKLSIHFTKPKRFEKFRANMHEYSPADLYYTIRITEHKDEWFLFQWFGQCYATQEHIENHYKKYPHFGPGGRTHTYLNKVTGKEELSYQPPIYNGFEPYKAESFASVFEEGNFYICDQYESLKILIQDFIQFLKDPKLTRFETDYPISK